MTNGGNFDGLPDVITNLINSPQIAEILKNSGLQNGTPQSSTPPPAAAQSSAPALSPEMLEKLPQIMAALSGGMMSQGAPPARDSAPAAAPSPSSADLTQNMPDASELAAKLPQVMNVLSSMGGQSGKGHYSGDKNRKTLLKALKPYMNQRKCQAIDKMLELDSMAEIMMLLMGGNK